MKNDSSIIFIYYSTVIYPFYFSALTTALAAHRTPFILGCTPVPVLVLVTSTGTGTEKLSIHLSLKLVIISKYLTKIN